MGGLGSHQAQMKHVGAANVVDIACRAGEKSSIFEPLDASANMFRPIGFSHDYPFTAAS
jgi:hypothetical protein